MRRSAARLPRPNLRPARFLRLVALAGFVPPMALAFYSLTEPWARARVVFFWGISRSPGAVILVVVALLGCLAAGIAVAARGRRPRLTAAVHTGAGLLLLAVSLLAFHMVRHAGVRALGLIPIASVRPGRGLRLFLLAACLLLALGVLELVLARAWRRRAPPPPSPEPCVP